MKGGKNISRPTKEVIARSMKKIYNRYNIALRKDSDADLIKQIEDNKSLGIPPTETIRELWKVYKTK